MEHQLRVVSLIASSTEIICALGFENLLVGRSHECDFPESVKRLPVTTEPKFNVEGTSYEIDQRVKAILQEGLSVYRVHADALSRLRPDLIVTQTQCEVCAVSQKDVEAAVCEIMSAAGGPSPRIVSLHPNQLADVWQDIERVAEALGDPDRGARLVRELRARMTAVASKAVSLRGYGGSGSVASARAEVGWDGVPVRAASDAEEPRRPRVAYIEWIEPLMAGGNWMPELVMLAGGENLFGAAGKHSPFFNWEEVVAANPDIIVVAPCGFDLRRTEGEMPLLTRRPEWAGLRAVREGRVFLADGNQYFNRPGPRVVESLEILAEIFHPGEFRFGHEGRGWKRF